MNTRLEIASRVLGAVLSTNATAPRGSVSFALSLADDLILAEELTRKATTPSHGTLADYANDVSAAQAAYVENPSSKNASDLHAAKDALERRQA